ncbi:PHD finger protein ALFIN-LIKE 4 [Capsicum chinense]|nr:PHD finger protein ALFIN-LIKE 4 [Capsicum chinense]
MSSSGTFRATQVDLRSLFPLLSASEREFLTGQVLSTNISPNGISIFQGLIERVIRTVRGSADDIGWLQRASHMPPTEDQTNRFVEILDDIRHGLHGLPNSVVYLLVPGLFSNYGPLYFVNTKTSFSKTGLACHIAKIRSEASVEKNAREIKDYIEEIYWGSRKRVLLLGHSKGGVDATAALSMYWTNLKDKEVPPELPEPALGINFARDGMQEKDWLSLVAIHSDSWLLSVAFYFGARFGFIKSCAGNSLLALNDVTAMELPDIVAEAAKHCDILRGAAEARGLLVDAMSNIQDGYKDDTPSVPLMVVENRCGSPCIDLRQASLELAAAAKDADLRCFHRGRESDKSSVSMLNTFSILKKSSNIYISIYGSALSVVAGDFNGHIGALPGGFGDVHGGFGFGERNEEGATLLEFARSFGLVVVNSGFPKKDEHLITFRSAIARTQIDFLLLRKGDRAWCKDCKVIPSENLSTQHRLLVMDWV